MAWTTPSTVVAGQTLSAAFWNEQVRDNLTELAPLTSAWTSYTPTLTNCTAPITYAKYLKVGRTVMFSVRLSLTGAQVSGIVGISLPFNIATIRTGVFSVTYLDTGAALYPGAYDVGVAGRIDLYVLNASGTYATMNDTSATVPFTWANNDQIMVGGVYEAAS